jgi:hypothetical protein
MRKPFIITSILLLCYLSCYSSNDSLKVLQIGLNGGINISKYSSNIKSYSYARGLNLGVSIKYNFKKDFIFLNTGIIQNNYYLGQVDTNGMYTGEKIQIVNKLNFNLQYSKYIIKKIYLTTGLFFNYGNPNIWGNSYGLSAGISFVPIKNIILSEITEIGKGSYYYLITHRVQLAFVF